MKAETKFDPEGKRIWIDLVGFADAKQTEFAVDEFEASLTTFPVDEFSLVINCREMATFKPEILPILERCYKLYEKFYQCIMINPEQTIAKIQIQRVARSTDFSGTFVATPEEAWNILNR
ncbi:hypothetical protein NDS46_30650 (plasmid) [Paenibacillus thiaminolyticus]|uniref:hypothetical protein n=1 Tax=Paenibacillus thiaminolyticus TaxID=49283 RepID=UPI00232B1F2C|nr:hypothetical protein [Paenibacillus thiaminolyticus]WCF11708.1 hypothetical protein NDS46_30650 [Paenibacillus thiaminolyticus]